VDTAFTSRSQLVAPALGTGAAALRLLEAEDHPRVAPLFAPSFPNLAFVHAVLEGRIPGQVFAGWEGRRARACLIATGSPFCFIAGEMPPLLLEEALGFLASRPPITLVCSAALEDEARASRHGFAATERLHFGGMTPEEARSQRVEVPEPYELTGIDARLFAQVNWKEMVHGIFGSAQAYVTHHFGFGLLHEGRLDGELKIRGIRVDPAEVEANIAAHPSVSGVAVVGVPLAGHTVLAAYLVPQPGVEAAGLDADVRRFLRERAPAHLIPARISIVSALAYTASGKVDRAGSHRRFAAAVGQEER